MASPKHSHHHHHHRAAASSLHKTKHRRPPLLRAMLHSFLCFLLGLSVGLAPSDWTDAASRAAADANAAAKGHVFRALHAVRAMAAANSNSSSLLLQYSRRRRQPPTSWMILQQQQQPQLLVVVTTTGLSEREHRAAGLTRTAHALRLVSPPVVWLVVEAARDAGPTALLLRRTGVPYRHLTYKDNFTSEEWEEERRHQRNLALAHVEHHRLLGVLFYAGLADVYDLTLLEHLRHIRTVGAWTVATVWEQERRVAVEGPVCTTAGAGAAAAAWFSAPTSDSDSDDHAAAVTLRPAPPLMSDDSVNGFAFATHLLWDPARWDRFPTTEPDQSQDSIKFVQRLVVEEYNKTMVIPDYSNCSQIMVWRVDTALI
ncbi:hypothetical protein U9M48_016297 [Paspalum notatum var. saurae]|uniref:Glycosyltransferases n=1 Tax=Paspalum notatum var. saurae TaxID=547442 RepID=A0AAQ3WMY1_PASNO